MYDKAQLTVIIKKDPSLNFEEKAEILDKLNDETFYESLVHGATGAAVGFAIAKFMKISKTGQVLLSLAGFGIGKYLLDETRKHDRFLQYNDKLKAYDIKA